MGQCCKKESREDYEFNENEMIREKIKIYSGGEGEINRYNLVRNVAFAMKEMKKKKLPGEAKKKMVAGAIKEHMHPNSYPEGMMEKMIENVIDDVYLSFKKEFKKRCC